jgi:hypothetical protein
LLGVIIGYVVYLCVTLFSGDLLHNTINFLSVYYPTGETILRETFRSSLASRPSKTTDPEKQSQAMRQSRENSVLHRHHSSLFDDTVRGGDHIIVGDMAMTSDHTHTTYDSTGHTNADFGTAFRQTITSPHQDFD